MIQEIQIREVQIQYGRKRKGAYDSVKGPSSAVDFLRKVAPNNSQEHVIALYLDAAHQPIGYSIVSTGLASSCPIHPREIFQRAIGLGAHSLILSHNHPSGQVQPSAEDRQVTKQIKEAGNVLGIKLLDHIVFSDSSFYSFQESGEFNF